MAVYLTTADRVRTALKIASATETDAIIDQLVADVSAEMASAMDRYVEERSRTEIFDLADRQEIVILHGAPIVSIASVRPDTDRAFPASATLVENDDWTADYGGDSGSLYLLVHQIAGRRVLQVTYTGGLGSNTAAAIAAYPEIASAATAEVSNRFQRRDSMSVRSVSSGQDVVSYGKYDFLSTTARVVRKFTVEDYAA